MKGKNVKKTSSSIVGISEEGIKFRSYHDGKLILLTPETTVRMQKALGSDIIIPLDELLPLNVNEKKLLSSLIRTHK